MSTERLTAIMEIARREGRVSVTALSELFQVTHQTIRKDLLDLCDQRLLARTHGGAVLSAEVENVHYDARRQIRADAKEAIGRAAADYLPDNASLFMNIGTTTEAVARALLQHKGLRVITNSINVASAMAAYPNIEVSVAGGVVRSADGMIAGEKTVDLINQYKVDYAIIGISSIDEDGVLLNYDFQNAKVVQAMIANSRHVILVVDSTKFERLAPVRVATLDQIDLLVTDRCTPEHIRKHCVDHGIELLETAPEA
ncbi:DeoR/GlpR family DNA-binding transcription regulator [Aminobacter sp. HY435]|uniref:DeoR/GlpR family DNA-binding transcription regulator n=1 Tax=Aminobacter sp. HY435 TaxID=2970917 RepID=UPI0022B96FB4|nr:DeoR/GlpR family DNA-binding transcription regulator [Aminobacter sp. HY435]